VNDVLNPNEIVFMGSPIDLISFTNIDNEKELSIDFLEIKSGNATLNKKQKLIRNAIIARRVFYKKVMLQ
jgi:predicted Holliday junction resolvase-like endonuclease